MERFIEEQKRKTLPILMYSIASFFVLFISNLYMIFSLYFLFIVLTYLLSEKKSTVFKVLKVSCFVVAIYFLVTSILGWQLNLKILKDIIHKGIGLSILVCTGIVVFDEMPTFQLVKITKLISPGENAIYAILSGFRTFPVIFNISSKVIVAQKARGIHKNYLLAIKTYLLNMIISFFEFIFDFGNQLEAVDMKNINNKNLVSLTLKNILFLSYLLISIGGMFICI